VRARFGRRQKLRLLIDYNRDMGRRLVVIAVLVPFLASLFGSALLADSEARYVTFTVKDRNNIFVRDLSREEVKITLDGKPVDVRFLAGKDLPTAFLVLLENSPRTAKFPVSLPQWGEVNPIDVFRYHMQYDFFPLLTTEGEVCLGEFYEEIKFLQDFTDQEGYLVNALLNMEPEFAGIVLNNIEVGRVLGRAVDVLKSRPEKRKVLLLFTRNIDRESYPNMDEYQLMLRNTDIDLYVVSIGPHFVSGPNHTFEERMNGPFFRALCGETGGRAYVTGEYTYLDELFTDLKGRLSNTYTAGFYVDTSHPVQEHELDVEVAREKSKVTHRKSLVY